MTGRLPSPSPRISRPRLAFAPRTSHPAPPDVNSSLHMNPRRFLPALFLLFVGSGCAALIYEIVWFQLLQLVIGSSSISLGILLGTFMGGMCLGSLLLPRMISRAAASAARLRGARARHRRPRPADPGRDAAGRRHLHRVGRRGHVRHRLPRGRRRHLPAAADDADGRDAAGDLALGQGDAGRHRRGSASSTAATSPAASPAACSPASTCCACSTSRPRRWSRSRSTSPWR